MTAQLARVALSVNRKLYKLQPLLSLVVFPNGAFKNPIVGGCF